jgi:SAM-dependent methyltransferase
MRLREKFKNYRLLLLSNDRIVANGWFKSVETATFDATSSLNDYAAHSYDFIICPHLLQSIADPRKGIQALARILSDEGLLFISYPSPVTREKTVDWGYAKKEQHGHYRTFGRDFESEYAYLVPDFYVVASQGIDPVTNSVDLAYFVTKNPAWVTHIIRTTDARLVS